MRILRSIILLTLSMDNIRAHLRSVPFASPRPVELLPACTLIRMHWPSDSVGQILLVENKFQLLKKYHENTIASIANFTR
jgi:hypothetical protein